MFYCERFGAEVGEDQLYCPKCGASTAMGVSRRRRDHRIRREDDLCFGRESGRDPLDLLEFGLSCL